MTALTIVALLWVVFAPYVFLAWAARSLWLQRTEQVSKETGK